MSIGKILGEKCNAYLLSETKIIAGGAINKFLRENNAVTVVVTVLETAIHGLHLGRSMEEINIPLTTLLQELENLQNMIIQ